jgi:murein tripeptide amidase MpaA
MRKHVVFKVIPMINPDGVIFGNYRTSLSGKDLNRMFRTKNQDLIP